MWLSGREPRSTDASGRERWGSEAAGVLFVARDPEGWRHVLLTLRSKEVDDPGVWGIPGGRVEPGRASTLVNALRETCEELGPIPRAVRRTFQIVGEDVYHSGGFTYTTFIIEADYASLWAWQPVLNWENDDVRLFPLRRVAKLNLHPNLVRILRKL